MVVTPFEQDMNKYLGKSLDIYGENHGDYVFHMELDDIITKPTGENDITKEIPKEEYPVFVDKTLDSYCTFGYLIENIKYLKHE
tara:strand:- start:742 stop:993 length:252 start_codon:yes stop_codon:yes gene_type:complete